MVDGYLVRVALGPEGLKEGKVKGTVGDIFKVLGISRDFTLSLNKKSLDYATQLSTICGIDGVIELNGERNSPALMRLRHEASGVEVTLRVGAEVDWVKVRKTWKKVVGWEASDFKDEGLISGVRLIFVEGGGEGVEKFGNFLPKRRKRSEGGSTGSAHGNFSPSSPDEFAGEEWEDEVTAAKSPPPPPPPAKPLSPIH